MQVLWLHNQEVLPSSSLTRGEREFACEYLSFTKNLVLDSVAGLSKAAMDARTEPGRWSMAENIEHLALAGDITWKILHEQLEKKPTPEKRASIRVGIKRIICILSDRSKKCSSLSGLLPAGRFTDMEAALAHFVRQRDRLIDYVRHTGDGLKDRHAFHPFVGTVNLYQFLLLEAAHTARHVLQIEEIKSEFGLYEAY
ncbi:MAG TPA: DinB family protein [Puia sp.]|nr:DinB family protein [Puia sp.]